MTTVTLQYYAQLREQAGAGGEQLTTSAASLRELYEELRTRHGFSLPIDALKVAVNAQFSDWSRILSEGDTVIFIPPVAGG
ncbi:MoaD/ThiS family protein [Rhodanobacter sp. B2A1Ga4]|uniref:MoaD/ThiS family protein n=1 Tax=Rhodanobacter sp. B2A1Ga4 TaxID=2778647 RepID=UPI001B35FFC3|nr:MoaD/ThiS family protein [Rhodanobacter sp. B2A1Ga4]MBQ4855872.1 MoaD/ThiS family protein [Rhodanobacter sp. B2A1Ga4]